MQLAIKTKNYELTPQLRLQIEEKVAKLERYLDNISTVTVEVTHEKTRSSTESHAIQLTLMTNGHLIRAEERSADPRSAFDSVIAIVQRQIVRYKEKLYSRSRKSGNKEALLQAAANSDLAQATAVADDEDSVPSIVRTKQFAVKPMTPEEAIEQMELLGHTFFFFQNDSSQQFNVLYRRRDGNYGLIEPEVNA